MGTYLLHLLCPSWIPCTTVGLPASIYRSTIYAIYIYVQHFNAITPPLLPRRGTGQHPSGHIARHPADGTHFLKVLRYRTVSVRLAPDALRLSSSQVAVPVPTATSKVQEHGGGMHQVSKHTFPSGFPGCPILTVTVEASCPGNCRKIMENIRVAAMVTSISRWSSHRRSQSLEQTVKVSQL